MPSSASSSLLVWEQSSSGHLLVYCRQLIDYAKAHNVRVHLALSPHAINTDDFLRHFGDPNDWPEILTAANFSDVVRAARQEHIGSLAIPHADPLLLKVMRTRLRGLRLHLLVMQDPRWERGATITRRCRLELKRLAIWAVRKRRGVVLRTLGPPTSELLTSVPDPVLVDDQRVRSVSHLSADDRFWFGLVGGITPHKNPMMVAEALKSVAMHSSRPLGLALIGPISPHLSGLIEDIEAVLLSIGVHVYVTNRVLTNDEMNDAVASLDCVVMAYSTHAPNSTSWKAAVLGTRFIAAGSEQFRRFASLTERGVTSDLNVDELAQVMVRCMDSPSPSTVPLPENTFASRLLAP